MNHKPHHRQEKTPKLVMNKATTAGVSTCWWWHQHWPYSWFSPHSLILLASCWAFFFSRQALQTDGKERALSVSTTRNSCRFLHMTHVSVSAGFHTESSWRAMKREIYLPSSLLSSSDYLTPRLWSETDAFGFRLFGGLKNGSEEWIDQCTLNINASQGDYSLASLQWISYFPCSCESAELNF